MTTVPMKVDRGPSLALSIVDPDQLRKYLAREIFLIRPGQADCCDRDGYVLVRHAGIGIGVGFFNRSESAVASLFPKHRADG